MPDHLHSAMCVLACRISGILTVLFGGMFVGYAISSIVQSPLHEISSSTIIFSVVIGGVMALAGSILISPSGTRRVARLVREGNIWSQLAHLPLAIGAIASVLTASVVYYQSRGALTGLDGAMFFVLVGIGAFFTYFFFSLKLFLNAIRLENHYDDKFELAKAEAAKPEKMRFSRAG